MEKVRTTIRKWGNSFGIVLPKKIVETENLEEGVEITITIEPKKGMTVGGLVEFAKKHPLPKPKRNYKELLSEVKNDFWTER